jgi:hypothetical protein
MYKNAPRIARDDDSSNYLSYNFLEHIANKYYFLYNTQPLKRLFRLSIIVSFLKNYHMKNLCLVMALVCAFCACKENISPQQLPFEGTWVFDSWENNTSTYRSAKELEDDSAGYIFNPDGTLTVRQTIGKCATPPVTYDNFAGTWKNLTNDTIAIQADYWMTHSDKNKQLNYKMYVVSSDDKTLKVNIIW